MKDDELPEYSLEQPDDSAGNTQIRLTEVIDGSPGAAITRRKRSSALFCVLIMVFVSVLALFVSSQTLNRRVDEHIAAQRAMFELKIDTEYEPCGCRLLTMQDVYEPITVKVSCGTAVWTTVTDYQGRPIRRSDIEQSCYWPSKPEKLVYFGSRSSFLKEKEDSRWRQAHSPSIGWELIAEPGFKALFAFGIIATACTLFTSCCIFGWNLIAETN